MCGKLWGAGLLLLSTTLPALADEAYFGLAYVNVANKALCELADERFPNAEQTYEEVKCNDDADTQQLLIGYQPWSWLAFEVKYFNNLDYRSKMSVASDNDSDLVKFRSEMRGVSLSALGVWDISKRFSAYASAGMMDWKIAYDFSRLRVVDDVPTPSSEEADASDRTAVVGVGFMIRGEEAVSLRIGAERVADLEEGLGFAKDLTFYSIGFQAKY